MFDHLLAFETPPYIPQEWVCIVFLAVFGLLSAFHTFQATFYQTWWFSLAVLSTGVLEIAGWGLRFKFSQNQADLSVFHSQYSILFIAPLPLFVAVWGTFLKIVPRLGYHFMRPLHSLYVQIIWVLYIATLVLEAVGVGEVSNATRIGGQVLFAGAYLYLALLISSNLFAIDIVTRYDTAKVLDGLEEVYARKRNNKQLFGLCLTEVFLLISAVFRAADITLVNRNAPIKQEWLFDIFGALSVVLTMVALSVFHPGQFHKDGPLSHESATPSSSRPSSPRMSHKQLPRINTNIVWKPRPQPGQQVRQSEKAEQEKAVPAPSRVVYAGNTKTTPPTL